MALGVYRTAYGRPAAELLRARLAAAKATDPLRPVTVVVPTNTVGVSVRRLLASGALGNVTAAGPGLAGVMFMTVYRLAELLGAPRLAAAGRRPVSTPVVAAAVRTALAGGAGHFAPIADHPSTERALVEAHRELSAVGPASLERLARGGARAADVVRLHRSVRARLRDGWYDEADLMAAAAEAVASGAPAAVEVGVVLLHLPQELSPPAARLLVTLGRAGRVEVLAGMTGQRGADRAIELALERLGALDEPGAAPCAPPPLPRATAVVSVSDAEEEVRAAMRHVLAALRDGTPLERVAVVYPGPRPYARLLHEHLGAAGIPYNGAAVRPLSERVAGRWLLRALRLADRGYRRQDVLDLLAGAPVLDRRGAPVPVASWERVSREAGIVGGHAEWASRLDAHARTLRERATATERALAAGEPDARPWLPAWLERQARGAMALRGFALELFGVLERGRRAGTWPELASWARSLLERYLGDEDARARWPEDEEVRAAAKVDAALDRLAALDAIEGRADVETFRRTLELELDTDLDRAGSLGHGMLAGTLGAALGVDLDMVVVLGCAEGVLPDRVREDSLLPDAERAGLDGELPLRADRVHTVHRQLLATLAAAPARVLCHPRGDLRRSIERPPSRWLVEAARAGRPADAPTAEHRASFAATVAAAEPASAVEVRLRTLARHRADGERLDAHPLARDDRALALGLALVRARASERLTRFDGDLSGVCDLVATPGGLAGPTSPTRLETWARCPLRYLLEHVLRVDVVENPEELLEISPLDRGTLVHEVLERWLEGEIDAGVPGPGEPWSPRARAALRTIGAEVCQRYEARGLVGHPLLWSRDRERVMLDLERFADHDDERRRQLRCRPVAAEVPFGLDGRPPVELRLAAGRTVRFRGKVDRLDAVDGGGLVVTDYKTGGSFAVKGLSPEDPLLGGTKLQLPVYALAARERAGTAATPVLAEYWFVTTRHGFARHGYEVGAGVLEALRTAVTTILDGIEGGYFPARPSEPVWRPFVDCPYCDPDGLGTADRWRTWRRKRDAPELRDYVALVEPGGEPPGGTGGSR